MTLREAGRIEDARLERITLLRVHSTHVNGLNDLGCDHWDRGETEDALNCFTTAVNGAPTALSARLNLIRLLCDTKRHVDAKPHLETLARQGLDVRVQGSAEAISIDINGSPFYRTKA